MKQRADAADSGRLNKARAIDRNGNPVETEITKNSRAHEERAGQKLAYIPPWNLA